MGLTKESLDLDLLDILQKLQRESCSFQMLWYDMRAHVEENSLDIDLCDLHVELTTLLSELTDSLVQNKIRSEKIRYVRLLGNRSFLIEH